MRSHSTSELYDHSTYRGHRIQYYGAIDERTGYQHNLYVVDGEIGVHNSPQGALDAIDWKIAKGQTVKTPSGLYRLSDAKQDF